ncbi:hypothetical protein [Glaciecola sp. SC05]|uniref:hypothetical protein n=1 Tax=Glaciecola sp. SC05 TaxID=1987355 RepID=UPI0035286CD6
MNNEVIYRFSTRFLKTQLFLTFFVGVFIIWLLIDRWGSLSLSKVILFVSGTLYAFWWLVAKIRKYQTTDRFSYIHIDNNKIIFKIKGNTFRYEIHELYNIEMTRFYPYLGRIALLFEFKGKESHMVWLKEYDIDYQQAEELVERLTSRKS